MIWGFRARAFLSNLWKLGSFCDFNYFEFGAEPGLGWNWGWGRGFGWGSFAGKARVESKLWLFRLGSELQVWESGYTAWSLKRCRAIGLGLGDLQFQPLGPARSNVGAVIQSAPSWLPKLLF